MQSLANLNSVSSNSITFNASETIAVNEGPSVYTARFPSWEAIRKLGNLSGNGITITQEFVYANVGIAGNVSISADYPSGVNYSMVGNTVTFTDITSVEDYKKTLLYVDIGDHINGNFAHTGNVINTNTGDYFEYDINVIVVPAAEFNKSTLSNVEYDYFGSDLQDLNNIVTNIGALAPRVRTVNQPANITVQVSIQDPNTSISLNTTSSADVIKTISNVGNVSLTISGSIANVNSHLSTLQMTKSGGGANINRQVRHIAYTAVDPVNSQTLETVTGNYWAAFEDSIHQGHTVKSNDSHEGHIYGLQRYVYPTRISFVGTHAGTGEPRFAVPSLTSSGNAAVKIFGMRLTSGAVVPGPMYVLDSTGGYSGQVLSSFDYQGNIGTANSTGSNTVAVKLSNASSTQGYDFSVGVDVGEVFNATGSSKYQYHNLYEDGSEQLAIGPHRIVQGNPGLETTHYVNYTSTYGNLTYSGTDWHQQYTTTPAPWGINQMHCGVDYDIIVKGYEPFSPTAVNAGIWPEARTYIKSFSANSVTAGSQLTWLNGQIGRLHHVVLSPGRTTGSKTITLWRGQTFLDNTEQQHIVHINALAHNAWNSARGSVVRDHLTTSNVSGSGRTHVISTTYSGNIAVSLTCSNTSMPSLTGVASSENYTPELFIRRGQTATFNINNTLDPVIITDDHLINSDPGNVYGISNNNIKNGNITFTPNASTPDHMYYRSTSNQNMAFNRGHIWIYDGDPNNNNARWGSIVPGAVALVRGGSDFAYMIYTKYTGSRTAGWNRSAGLYYRRITVNSDYSLTWGTPVLVQDPAQTGDIYGIQMAAQSTVINGVTYVLCSIMPRSPTSWPADTTVVGIRIVN